MSEENPPLEQVVRLTEGEEKRLKIIEELGIVRQQMIQNGSERHLPDVDRLEEVTLNSIDKRYKEE